LRQEIAGYSAHEPGDGTPADDPHVTAAVFKNAK
jgi:hypothetical protein